jgi:hypothetical protein
LLALFAGAGTARAQTAILGSSDFTLVLSRIDSSGAYVALGTDALASFLSAARCSCPIDVGVAIGINSDAVAKLTSADTFDVTLMIGADCDNVAATNCTSVGANLTLNSGTTQAGQLLSTGDLFAAAAPSVSCSALSPMSGRLWAVVRQNGVRLTTQPSLTFGVGSARPGAPSALATTTADSGLVISWTAPSTTAAVQGYQALCAPAPTTPPAAAFDACTAGSLPTGTGPFATLDPALICSDLVSVGTNSVRVHGLQNGTVYQVAVVSIGADGTPSGASTVAQGTPGPTFGFDDLYKQSGGTGLAGCAVAGRWSTGGTDRAAVGVVMLALAVTLMTWRRRRRRPRRHSLPALLLGFTCLAAGAAHAAVGDNDHGDDNDSGSHGYRFGEEAQVHGAGGPSPRNWNLELRAGPYYPSVDSEFADRGQTARPYQQIFSSKQRLMTGLEIDRHILHRAGTWAIGFGIGAFRAAASALAADQLTRSGDQTVLRFFPLSLQAIYRASQLRERWASPVVPYAKLGLDCAIWQVSDDAKSSSTTGTTLGWNAAVGFSLDLTFLDPDGMRTMDVETGVNTVALFVEVAHLGLSGFGSSSVLRLGDNTWAAGLMFEM